MTKHIPFVERNNHGWCFGGIKYPDGTVARVTNAKLFEYQAREIAQRMAKQLDIAQAEKEQPR